MKDSNGGAPSWLFSFVDLAFLMLIAMTQLAPDPTDERPDLGELVVPRIATESTNEMPSDAAKAWHSDVDYQPMIKLRNTGSSAEALLVKGIEG